MNQQITELTRRLLGAYTIPQHAWEARMQTYSGFLGQYPLQIATQAVNMAVSQYKQFLPNIGQLEDIVEPLEKEAQRIRAKLAVAKALPAKTGDAREALQSVCDRALSNLQGGWDNAGAKEWAIGCVDAMLNYYNAPKEWDHGIYAQGYCYAARASGVSPEALITACKGIHKHSKIAPTAGQLNSLAKREALARRGGDKQAKPVSPEWEKLAQKWENESKRFKLDPEGDTPEALHKRRIGEFWTLYENTKMVEVDLRFRRKPGKKA